MIVLENIRLALFSLKANKMRAFLTMLGIIIGIASVIAIMTVGNSLKSMMTDSMASIGANNITVGLQQREDEEESTEEGLQFGGPGGMKSPADEDGFTYEMLENYCEQYGDSIQAISVTESLGSGVIEDGNLYANVTTVGTSTGYYLANDITMLSGRFFKEQEMEDASMVAIVSTRVADNMFEGDYEAAVGQNIQVNTGDKYYNFTISGVYEYEENAMTYSTASTKDTVTELYIPVRTAKELSHTENYLQFTVVTQNGVDSDEFAETTKHFFDTYYRNNRDFQPTAFSMASMVSIMTDMLSTTTTGIAVIAGIALVVGGIGVMNIMLVSITERTREIGTRKALGAPNSSIRLQFIVEAIVICLIGGILGIILGIVMGSAMSNLMNTTTSISMESIVLSLSFSMAIGIFFGYYPANKAAKMDPIEALRYE